MQAYSFTIHLAENDITDEQADKFYNVAPDSTLGVACGRAYISFDREGCCYNDVVKQAFLQVKSFGFTPIRVEKE